MKHVLPARSHSKSWGHGSEGDRRCSWLLSVWLGTHKMNQQVNSESQQKERKQGDKMERLSGRGAPDG